MALGQRTYSAGSSRTRRSAAACRSTWTVSATGLEGLVALDHSDAWDTIASGERHSLTQFLVSIDVLADGDGRPTDLRRDQFTE